jgi:carbon-monoxide dehydrogenase large subunit
MNAPHPGAATGAMRIGDSARRLEDADLLAGRARFLDDVAVPADTLHAAFIRSAYAHANLRKIDAGAAQAEHPEAIVRSYADLADLLRPIQADPARPGFAVTFRHALVKDRARFVGDPVAICFAPDPYVAQDMVELVEIDMEPLDAVASIAASTAAGAVLVHDEAPANIAFEAAFETEGFDAVHAKAVYRLRETFTAGRVAAVSMEPRGCVAIFDRASGALKFWSSTQVPFMLRTCLAEHLGLPEDKIEILSPAVGGGFGMKAAIYPEEIAIAAAAIKLGRPVKWVQDRYDDLLSSAQARDHVYEVEIGFDADGKVTSLLADVAVSIGAYPLLPFGSSLEANGAPRNLPGPYTLQNFKYRTRAVFANTAPTSAYRGVSAPLACFAMEGMMDRIARRLGLDPVDVRRRNLIETFPYANVLGLTLMDGCFRPALDRAVEMIGHVPGLPRHASDASGRRHGIGFAVVTEQTGMGGARYRARGLHRVPGYESATVKLGRDGRVAAHVSLTAQGQGHATSFAQIVVDALGCVPADVSIVAGDTANTPPGTGTFASRGMVLGGNALLKAAQGLRADIARVAADLLQADTDGIEIADSAAFLRADPGRRATLREIAAHLGESGLERTERHDPEGATVASTVHAVRVAVDPELGTVAIVDYAVVHDCGRMINPLLVDGQIHGAIAQGLGEVLKERIKYAEDGQPLSVSLLDYHLPRASEMPQIRIEALHSEAGGTIFKGVGESGIIGAVPAIANAISDALRDDGYFVNVLPVEPARLIEALHGARKATR